MGKNNNIIKQIRRTVLIVEDEPINSEILSEILSDTYDIETAGNGKEALSFVKESLTPHLPDPSGHQHAGHGRVRIPPDHKGGR